MERGLLDMHSAHPSSIRWVGGPSPGSSPPGGAPPTALTGGIQAAVAEAFQGLLFQRVPLEEGRPGAHVTYAARLEDMLSGPTRRYVIVHVPRGVAPTAPSSVPITALPWAAVQTRKLPPRATWRLPPQPWRAPRHRWLHDLPLLVRERTAGQTTYGCETPGVAPFKVICLHDPALSTAYQFRDRFTVAGALETFACVVSYQ